MAATSTSDAQSTASEGPALTFLNKRIRALRKKQTRILQMEESLSQGKSLNTEQQEVLRSKPGVFALIDELEKLRSPLSAAVSEEVSLALQSHRQAPVNAVPDAADSSSEDAPAVSAGELDSSVVDDLLNLLYFGNLFDVMPQRDFTSVMLTKTHERGCCLTYDYVTDDATDLLVERDLDLIAALKGLVISRPVSSGLSHKNALHRCIEHAKLWLEKSDQPIDPQSNITYAGLREKLSKIMSSDYYTATPEMRGPVEMVAAAGAANFGSFQVPLHGSVVPVSMPTQVEESIGQYQEGEENTKHEEYEITAEHQYAPVEELQKENLEAANSTEEVSFQIDGEKVQAEDEQQQDDLDSKGQQQYMPRRPYQNYRGVGGRGGRRGGYPNGRGGRGTGRGGGPYQNGRGQYYEQQGIGNYYPRNNYRGRGGGRGNNGGGNSYYNHSPGMQGPRDESNVGRDESNVGLV